MKYIDKYRKAYGKQFNKEMLWDIALRNKSRSKEWKIVEMANENFWGADPFLVEYKSNIYLFYERFDRKKGIGEIAVSTVNDDLTTSNEVRVLSRPYHLSFPYVFEYKNQYYMIPETGTNQTIEVYKSTEFPYAWELHKTILTNLKAVDTIVLDAYDSGLTLHTSITDSDACSVENWLIWLDSDFNYIKKKKVKNSSEYGNRNAGKPLTKNQNIFRLGQDCRNGEYGTGLVAYLIEGENEEEIKYIGLNELSIVDSKYSGTHTYNTCGQIETIDLRFLKRKNFLEKVQFLIVLGGNYVKRRIHR